MKERLEGNMSKMLKMISFGQWEERSSFITCFPFQLSTLL